MKKQYLRERECIHRDEDAPGEFYNGVFYVQALGRLKIEAAMRIANKVGPFFWVDAPHILVWLCNDCAAELHLVDTPLTFVKPSRRQA
jgi:hypothetical protein